VGAKRTKPKALAKRKALKRAAAARRSSAARQAPRSKRAAAKRAVSKKPARRAPKKTRPSAKTTRRAVAGKARATAAKARAAKKKSRAIARKPRALAKKKARVSAKAARAVAKRKVRAAAKRAVRPVARKVRRTPKKAARPISRKAARAPTKKARAISKKAAQLAAKKAEKAAKKAAQAAAEKAERAAAKKAAQLAAKKAEKAAAKKAEKAEKAAAKKAEKAEKAEKAAKKQRLLAKKAARLISKKKEMAPAPKRALEAVAKKAGKAQLEDEQALKAARRLKASIEPAQQAATVEKQKKAKRLLREEPKGLDKKKEALARKVASAIDEAPATSRDKTAGAKRKAALAPAREGRVTALREPVLRSTIPLPMLPPPRRPSVEERSAKLEQRLQAQSEEFRQRYIESFDMSWIYHDSALEGVVYTFEELRNALTGQPPPLSDSGMQPTYDDIRRHKEAIDYVRDFATKKRLPVTVDVIKKIYLILHPEEGDIKTVKYRKDVPQHRLYFHEYAPPDKIAYKVRQIVDWLNDPETRKTRNGVRIAARAHYDLLRVYPFAADSGKVSRLFMNLLLLRSGLHPSIIHSTERQRYYEALKGSATTVLQMVQEAVENALSSAEKLLDEHETRKRAFVS
jgi:hypothetical protein